MMKNMQINTRLITSFMIVVAMLVVTGITSILMLSRVGNALQDFHQTSYQTVTNSWRAKQALADLRAYLLQATIEQDERDSASYISSAYYTFDDYL